jgi:hypothetical protein
MIAGSRGAGRSNRAGRAGVNCQPVGLVGLTHPTYQADVTYQT